MKKILEVKGMTCSHCEKSVKSALVEVAGVNNVDVNLDTKLVTVEGDDLEDKVLVDAVEGIGFDVSKVE
ncbi:heavy-metal-associated domain-containing protein [Miniphocaeibacter massiliensis]|uniref:heavy-metal-associated domain-containing protein n=1 Tax=Miniphocaeibacter massiliensis TaxID=2041841 RepID=UPI000C0745A9|nr:cation transporter [Miniphocaeibacter massiliensis]